MENHILALTKKHREVDLLISKLEKSESIDHLEIAKLKKERLAIKDEIVQCKKKLMLDSAMEK